MPVGHSGYLQVRCSQKLVGRLLDRTCDAVSRIGGPLILSESAICHSPSLFPPSILAAHDSVLLSIAPKLICFCFCSSGVLELLFWKPGFPQKLSHSWVIV